MIEWAWSLLPPAGWLCWAIGGTGFKWVRRYCWPALVGIGLLTLGIVWWRSLLTAISYSATLHLGYGEGKSWLWRTTVGASYGVSLLWIEAAWWVPVATAVWFVGHMAVSRSVNAWTWKIVEGSQGVLHGGFCVWLART